MLNLNSLAELDSVPAGSIVLFVDSDRGLVVSAYREEGVDSTELGWTITTPWNDLTETRVGAVMTFEDMEHLLACMSVYYGESEEVIAYLGVHFDAFAVLPSEQTLSWMDTPPGWATRTFNPEDKAELIRMHRERADTHLNRIRDLERRQ